MWDVANNLFGETATQRAPWMKTRQSFNLL